MFSYMKITDIHLKDSNLEHKLMALEWAAEMAINRNVNVVLNAGDLTEKDHFAGRNATPGAMVKDYWHAFSGYLKDYRIPVHHVRGNHDKKSASRGSSLYCFAGANDVIHEQIECEVFRTEKNEHHGVVFVPWMYPEELLGGYDPQQESQEDYRKRFLDTVADQVKHIFCKLDTDCASIALVAHCQVAGANLSASQMCKGDEGMVLRRDILDLFTDLHLGDIHLRQEVLPNRGGFTGALTQEGFDEEDNPSGVEFFTIDDNGQVEREWLECPVAKRYQTIWVSSLEEAGKVPPAAPDSITRVRFAHDGSSEAAAIAAALEPLARQGMIVDPQWELVRKEARTEERLEKLDDPHGALNFYCRAYDVPTERREELHLELTELLG